MIWPAVVEKPPPEYIVQSYQMDVDVEAFEVMGAPACVSCRRGWDET
jgi:hypothetical protein